MVRKLRFGAVILLMLVLIALCRKGAGVLKGNIDKGRETSAQAAGQVVEDLVVIDPGHGGMDGGKKGVNGVEEKEINLKVSLVLKEYLEADGIQVVMTRETEERIGSDQVSDLKARVAVMNEEKPALAVSIHQNSYHQENVRGAQVFYHSESEEGKRAAQIIQECFKKLDPENTKEAKANNTYYILKKTEVPTVIAECGFLSNYEDAEMLADEEYQKEVARAIADGILQYMKEKG